jgi:hypothetical protein
MKRSRSLAALVVAFSPLLAPAVASAAPTGLIVAAGHGQQAIAVTPDAAGVRVNVCASGPCSADGGAVIAAPDAAKASLAGARVSPIELAGGKRIVRVDVPLAGAAGDATWVLLVAAPLAGKAPSPVVIWSGVTGATKGELGEERSAVVLDEPSAGGGRRVLVGERRDDVTLCGRPTLVAAKEIDPGTLELTRAASVQNLGVDERARAVKVDAVRVPDGEALASGVRLLRAIAASSAVDKKLGTLTDGDAETIWSENKAGSGEGEFVTMSSADEVGVVSFTITVRPKADVEGGAAPRTFYLATSDRLFEVKMPEDAWKQPPGARYTVKLPAELHAGCVAVVLGAAFAAAPRSEPASKLPRVTLAEVEAVTTFGAAAPEALVGALAGGGERARAAAALLSRGGPLASQAAIAGYDKLDDAGKQLAAGVVDAAPCSEQAPFFAARFAALSVIVSEKKDRPRAAPGEIDPELAHARDRLRRCGRAAAGALGKLITEGAPETSLLAAQELALIAPAEAVPLLFTALAKADDAGRRALRAALSRAATAPRSWPAIAEEMAPTRFGAQPLNAQIDLLRAVGPSLPQVEGAAPAFAALATAEAPMRTRYLLLSPAAALARGGDARASTFLRDSLRKDADPHLRARAAEVAGSVEALRADLALAVEDPEVRVREAAINALGDAAGSTSSPGLDAALLRRLAADDWTIVRAAAARTIGALPASPALDAALAGALADRYPEVRGRAIDALGAHKALAYAEPLRKRAMIAEESLDLRARSVLALAEMCDKGSLDLWTKLAENAVKPQDERDRRLGGAAVTALALYHPADLAQRLAPLLAKDAPPGLNEMARTALRAGKGCQ